MSAAAFRWNNQMVDCITKQIGEAQLAAFHEHVFSEAEEEVLAKKILHKLELLSQRRAAQQRERSTLGYPAPGGKDYY